MFQLTPEEIKIKKYHLTMILQELNKHEFPNKGDTRNYLSIDKYEHALLTMLINKELLKYI